MPFRPVRVELEFGKPEHLVTAGPGDVEIQVSCDAFGSVGASSAPNYVVGVKDQAGDHVAGKLVTSGEYTTDLEEGDELWVAAAEDLSFTSKIFITGLIRSTSQGGQGGGDGKSKSRGRRDPGKDGKAGQDAEQPQPGQDQGGDDGDPAE